MIFLWLPLKDLDGKGWIWYDIDFTSNRREIVKRVSKTCVFEQGLHIHILSPAATFILSVPMILYLSLSINMVTQDGLPTWKLSVVHMFWRKCSNGTIVKVVEGVLQPLLSQLFLLNSKRSIRKLSTGQPLLYLQHCRINLPEKI